MISRGLLVALAFFCATRESFAAPDAVAPTRDLQRLAFDVEASHRHESDRASNEAAANQRRADWRRRFRAMAETVTADPSFRDKRDAVLHVLNAEERGDLDRMGQAPEVTLRYALLDARSAGVSC